MNVALWAYPWDLVDEGVETVADRLAAVGASEVSVATNYHALQAFLPHNPRRRTFFARSSAYFQPRRDYGRLRPIPNETMGEADWIETIDAGLAETSLDFNSWTVGCHNSRLGMAHPDLTLETAHGDSLVFGLCPSQAAVQNYLVDLVAEIDARFAVHRIELETFDYFYGTGFRWHHEKYHTRLGQLGEFLFGLCFCDACRATASAQGVDVDVARETVREAVDAIAAQSGAPDGSLEAWLEANPTVAAYVEARTGTLTDLFERLNRAVDADIGYYVGLFDAERSWMHGADLAALEPHVDYYVVTSHESSRSAVLDDVAAVRAQTSAPVHAGILPGHPAVHSGATVSDIVAGLADADVERVAFYNYGLLPDRAFDWIEAAVAPYV